MSDLDKAYKILLEEKYDKEFPNEIKYDYQDYEND